MESKKQQQPAQQQHADDLKRNAAVVHRPPHPFGGREPAPVQRIVECSVHEDDANKAAAITFEKNLDNSVASAYNHVVTAPNLGIDDGGGHLTYWQENWQKTMNNEKVDLLAASFGYAIESLVTISYPPAVPSGYSADYQATRGNTRPDLILMKDNVDVAWLDITASNSKGHIWGKGPPYWNAKPHASEISYASLNPATITLMKQNNNNKAPVNFDSEAFKERLNAAKELVVRRKAHWIAIGKKVKNMFDSSTLVRKKTNSPKLNLQGPMLLILCDVFNLGYKNQIIYGDYDSDFYVDAYEDSDASQLRKDAPNILASLGLNSFTYGFGSGAVQRGEAWLMQNDRNMPVMISQVNNNDNNTKNDDNTNNNANNNVNNNSNNALSNFPVLNTIPLQIDLSNIDMSFLKNSNTGNISNTNQPLTGSDSNTNANSFLNFNNNGNDNNNNMNNMNYNFSNLNLNSFGVPQNLNSANFQLPALNNNANQNSNNVLDNSNNNTNVPRNYTSIRGHNFKNQTFTPFPLTVNNNSIFNQPTNNNNLSNANNNLFTNNLPFFNPLSFNSGTTLNNTNTQNLNNLFMPLNNNNVQNTSQSNVPDPFMNMQQPLNNNDEQDNDVEIHNNDNQKQLDEQDDDIKDAD